MLAIWFLVPLPFLNPAWTSGSIQCTYCWSLAWRILSITLLVCDTHAIAQSFEHSLALPFFGIGVNVGLSQSRGHSGFPHLLPLSAALSQHHLSGLGRAHLESHHLHWLCSQWCFLRPETSLIPHLRVYFSPIPQQEIIQVTSCKLGKKV